MRESLASLPLILFAFASVGCSAGSNPSSELSETSRSFAQYLERPHYRAFAVTGGTLDGPPWATATGYSTAPAIDVAITRALAECSKRRRDPVWPRCNLYAIGDLIVAGADELELSRAECVYILDLTAVSVDGSPHALPCASFRERTISGTDSNEIVLDETAIKAEIIGNTLSAKGSNSFYVYLDPNGTSRVRYEEGQDLGFWRVNEDGDYCQRWRRVRDGRETCNAVVRHGDRYKSGIYEFSLIEGNPFRL